MFKLGKMMFRLIALLIALIITTSLFILFNALTPAVAVDPNKT